MFLMDSIGLNHLRFPWIQNNRHLKHNFPFIRFKVDYLLSKTRGVMICNAKGTNVGSLKLAYRKLLVSKSWWGWLTLQKIKREIKSDTYFELSKLRSSYMIFMQCFQLRAGRNMYLSHDGPLEKAQGHSPGHYSLHWESNARYFPTW